ncbi:uncharacterized protein PAC_00723 [Phialocephala subalpina]|uniref:Uncharacterized protein n=1 Tax=Phialocephala subalpina TaxID=576137 RepID=A0A1L7WDR0_9HELO|nr:uncharacterized protein PAC_00723 [Phialocephala subalpina]
MSGGPDLPLFPVIKHNRWEKISVHTAKCDLCHTHNTTVMQRCKSCNQQICKKCIDHVHKDGKHEVIGELDWTPGPSPAAESARRTPAKNPRKKETPTKTLKSSPKRDRVLSSNATPSRISKRQTPGRIASRNVAYYREEDCEGYPDDFEEGGYEDEIVHSGGSRRGNQRQRNETQYEPPMHDPRVGRYPDEQQGMRSYYQHGPQLNRQEGYVPAGHAFEDPFTDSRARAQGPQHHRPSTTMSVSGRRLVGPPRNFHYEEPDDERFVEELTAMHPHVSGHHREEARSRHAEEGGHAMQSGHRDIGREEGHYAEKCGHAMESRPREQTRYAEEYEEAYYAEEGRLRRDSRVGRQEGPRQAIPYAAEGCPRPENRPRQQGQPRQDVSQGVPEIYRQNGYFDNNQVYHHPVSQTREESHRVQSARQDNPSANEDGSRRSSVQGRGADSIASSIAGRTNDNRSPDMGRPRVENRSPANDHQQQAELSARDARIAEIQREFGEFDQIIEMLDANNLEEAEQLVAACEALVQGSGGDEE